MVYLKVAIAAILRYRLEAPFREQYHAKFPRKKQNISFGAMTEFMAQRKLLDRQELRETRKIYKKLSRSLHTGR